MEGQSTRGHRHVISVCLKKVCVRVCVCWGGAFTGFIWRVEKSRVPVLPCILSLGVKILLGSSVCLLSGSVNLCL